MYRTEAEKIKIKTGFLGRIKSCAGFSLAETMAVLVVVSLIALALGTGAGVVNKVYRRIAAVSSAQVLRMETITALREVFAQADSTSFPGGEASPEEAEAGGEVPDSGAAGGSAGSLCFKNTAGEPVTLSWEAAGSKEAGSIKCVVGTEAAGMGEDHYRLVNPAIAERLQLYVSCTGMTYDAASRLVTVSGLEVYNLNGEKLTDSGSGMAVFHVMN